MARSKASKGLVDDKYKAWIAQFPCVVCSAKGRKQTTRTTVAHVGPRGFSQKCSDHQTLPICVEHHQEGPEAHHKLGKNFWTHHGLLWELLVEAFYRAYLAGVTPE